MKKYIFSSILSLAIFSFLFANSAEAILVDKPFGGKSSTVTLCTCDGSYMISMPNLASGGVPETFIYSPYSTTLYANFLFMMSDVWMIGTADLFMTQCMQLSNNGCTPIGFGYRMNMLGTSL